MNSIMSNTWPMSKERVFVVIVFKAQTQHVIIFTGLVKVPGLYSKNNGSL